MKCPKCELITSNTRDDCPRCGFDLRPTKLKLGLPINTAAASSPQLRASVTQKPSPSTPFQPKVSTPSSSRTAPSQKTAGQAETTSKTTSKKPWLSFFGRKESSSKLALQKPIDAASPSKQTQEHKPAPKPEEKPASVPPKATSKPAPKALAMANTSAEQEPELEDLILALEELPADDESEEKSEQSSDEELAELLDLMTREEQEDSGAEQLEQEPITDFSELDEDEQTEERAIILDELAEQSSVDSDLSNLFLEEGQEDIQPTEQSEEDEALFSELDLAKETGTQSTYDSAQGLSQATEEKQSAAMPEVAPKVLEFSDDDQELEQKLDEMIGGVVLDIEAVKVKKPESAPAKKQDSFELDDMEFSIEFEDEDSPQESADSAQGTQQTATAQVEAEDELLEGLLQTFAEIERDDQFKSLAASSEEPKEDSISNVKAAASFPVKQLEAKPTAFPLPTSTNGNEQQLIQELTTLLAEAYGVTPETLLGQVQLKELESELEHELGLLLAEGTSFYSAEEGSGDGPSEAAVQDEPIDELASLESELDAELLALGDEGVSLYQAGDESLSPDTEQLNIRFCEQPSEKTEEFSSQAAETADESSASEGDTDYAEELAELLSESEKLGETEQLDIADGDSLVAADKEPEQDLPIEPAEAAASEDGIESENSEEVEQEVPYALQSESLEFGKAAEIETEANRDTVSTSESLPVDEFFADIATDEQAEARQKIEAESFETGEAVTAEIVLSEEVRSDLPASETPEDIDSAAVEASQVEQCSPSIEQSAALSQAEPEVAEDFTIDFDEEDSEEETIQESELQTGQQEEQALDEPLFEMEDLDEDSLADQSLLERIESREQKTINLEVPLEPPLSEEEPAANIVGREDDDEFIELNQLLTAFKETNDESALPSSSEETESTAKGAEGEQAPAASSASSQINADELWPEVENEVRSEETGQSEVEIGVNELCQFKRSESVDILFDLIEEELVLPGKKRASVRAVPTSEERKVDNTTIQKAVTRYQQEEKVRAQRQIQEAREPRIEIKEVVLASRTRRFAAFVVDCVVTTLLALGLSWFLVLSPALKEQLLAQQMPSPIDLLPIAANLVSLWVSVLLAVEFLSVLTSSQTTGKKLFGIEVVNYNGTSVNFGQAFVRALGYTTVFLSLGVGLLPSLGRKRRAIHDYMSRTQVILKQESENAL